MTAVVCLLSNKPKRYIYCNKYECKNIIRNNISYGCVYRPHIYLHYIITVMGQRRDRCSPAFNINHLAPIIPRYLFGFANRRRDILAHLYIYVIHIIYILYARIINYMYLSVYNDKSYARGPYAIKLHNVFHGLLPDRLSFMRVSPDRSKYIACERPRR